MKKILCFFVSVFFLGNLFSQEINCANKLGQLSSYINDNNYKQANEILSEIKISCATNSEDLYLLGIKVLQNNVDISYNEKKELAIKELIKFYDAYDKNFPENKNGNLIKKAMLLYENNSINDNEIFLNLDKAFKNDKFQFDNPNALFVYFKLFKEKYDNKNNAISSDDLIEKFGQVQNVIEKNKVTFIDKSIEFENAKLATTSLVRDEFTTEKVTKYAENNFEKNINNIDWLATTSTLLSERNPASLIFGTIANQLNVLNPTSKSVYHLANYNLKNRKIELGINYLIQSAQLSEDRIEKNQIYNTLATIYASIDKAKSKEMIQNAIAIEPTNGDNYIFLYNLYIDSINECSTTELEKKAIIKLSKTTLEKAIQIDSRYKIVLEQLEKKHNLKLLTSEELKQVKKAGGFIKVACWINESVTF